MPVNGPKDTHVDFENLPDPEVGPELPEVHVRNREIKGQFVKTDTASFPFLSSAGQNASKLVKDLPEPALEQLRGNVMPSGPAYAQEFQRGGLAQKLRTTKNSFGKPIVPSPTQSKDSARWRTMINHAHNDEYMKEHGISEKSPLARMNRAEVPQSMNRTFFRERARAQGFRGNDDTYSDTEAIGWLEKTKAHVLNAMGRSTKSEHGYFALDMARIMASNVSLKEHEAERNPTPFKDRWQQAQADGSGSRLKVGAEIGEESFAYRDRMPLLTHDGIEAGVKELQELLDPNDDAERHFESVEERQKIVRQFKESCRDYNAAVTARIKARDAQRAAAQNAPLTHLGMPVDLRGEKIAEDFFSDASYALQKESGLAPSETLGEWLWSGVKNLAAVIGSLTVLPLLIPAWRDFVASRFFAAADERDLLAAAFKQQVRDLKHHNQQAAENWVREAYRYNPDDSAKRVMHGLRLEDPHGLFAAFANYSRKEIVDAVKAQLKLSAEADLLEAREDQARRAGVNVDHKAAKVSHQEYYTDDYYLSEIADGIVDGMESALSDALVEQLKQRHDGLMTTTADAFVKASEVQINFIRNRAWDAANKMVGRNLYSNTRNADFNAVLEDQVQYLQDIENDMELAKEGPVAPGMIEGLRGTLDIPEDGPRMQYLETLVEAARAELTAAHEAAVFVSTMLGNADAKGSMLWIDGELDCDALGIGLESGDTIEKSNAAYDEYDGIIQHQSDQLTQRASLLTDELYEELNDMLTNLQSRSANQRHIRRIVIEMDEKIRTATSAEDLENLSEQFKKDVDAHIELIEKTANWGRNANIKEIIASHKERRDETISRLNSTRQLFEVRDAARVEADTIAGKVRAGDLQLDIGLQQIGEAYQPVLEAKAAHEKKWSRYAGIGDRFTDLDREISGKRAQAFMDALQISPENREPIDAALPSIDFLNRAGVLNDSFVTAFRRDLVNNTKAPDKTPTASELASVLKKLGTEDAGKDFVPTKGFFGKFSKEYIHPFDGDRQLNLTLKLLREAGANADELYQAKRNHYDELVRVKLGSVLDDSRLLKMFRSLKLVKRDPRDHDEKLIVLERLFRKLPALFGEQDDSHIKEAFDIARILFFKRPDSLTDEQIAQGVALAERIAEIDSQDRFNSKSIKAKYTESEHKRSAKLQNQIADVFGYGNAEAFDEPERVKDGIDLIISRKSNRRELRSITDRSVRIQSLLNTQQESARNLEGAVLKPLKEFARMLDANATAEDARHLMESEEFREKAHTLENLNRLLMADDKVRDASADAHDNIYMANLEALTRLSRELRDFKPTTMEAGGNRISNRLAMWWNEEKPKDVVQSLRDEGSEDVAKRFMDVRKHLVMLNALGQSEADLSTDLQKLAREREALMTKLQSHRSRQIAMMAVLKEFDRFGGAANDFKLTNDRIRNINKTLAAWGQPGAWDALRDHYNLDANSFSPGLLSKWSADSNGFPADIQNDVDKLKTALAGFEALVTSLEEANSAIAETQLSTANLRSPAEQQRVAEMQKEQLQRVKQTKSTQVFSSLLRHPPEDWSTHPDWRGTTDLAGLSGQRLPEFQTSFSAALTETFPYDTRAGDLIRLLKDIEDFDQEVRAAKTVMIFGMMPSKTTVDKLSAKADALQAAAQKLQPERKAARALKAAKTLEDKNLLDLICAHAAKDVSTYVTRQRTTFEPDEIEVINPYERRSVQVAPVEIEAGPSKAQAATPQKPGRGFMDRFRAGVAEVRDALAPSYETTSSDDMAKGYGDSADLNAHAEKIF